MYCMSKKIQQAKNKVAKERYTETLKNRTPEEQAEADKRGQEAMRHLAVAASVVSAVGDSSYIRQIFK